jgi:hypothetical protein
MSTLLFLKQSEMILEYTTEQWKRYREAGISLAVWTDEDLRKTGYLGTIQPKENGVKYKCYNKG